MFGIVIHRVVHGGMIAQPPYIASNIKEKLSIIHAGGCSPDEILESCAGIKNTA